MAIDLEQLERSLGSLGEARAVLDMARRYLEAWPDLYGLARSTAKAYLLEHTGRHLDPDQVWWNVFETAVGAPTFTGWRHAGPPLKSITFTELLVQRFAGGFEQASDELPVYAGFYTQGAGGSQYGEHNQVALDAVNVMSDFWALDFAGIVRQRTERFWNEQGRDFSALAKVRLLAEIDDARDAGELSELDRLHLRQYLGLAPLQPVTQAALHAEAVTGVLAVRKFVLDGRAHLFTLQAPDGRVVLYIPAAPQPLKGFTDHPSLLAWVHGCLAGPDALEWVKSWYRAHPHAMAQPLQQELLVLRQRSGPAQAPVWPFGEGTLLNDDLFVTFKAWAKADTLSQQAVLVTNAQLRRELWRGYLGAFLQVFGGVAPLAWPIGLALVGAGVARLVLDVQTALDARSVTQRQNAIVSAVADAVVTVFSIIDAGLGARALLYRAPPHERLATPDVLRPVEGQGDELPDLDGNRILPSPQTARGHLEGISVTEDGATWIEMSDLTLRVRYSPEARHWLAVDDEDPFAFLPTVPLRIVEDGRWQLMDVPAPSGVVTPGLDLVVSPFWDIYMQDNEALRQELSAFVLERQRAVLEKAGLPTLAADAQAQFDAHGYRYVEVDGHRFYTYRQGNRLCNQLVELYSDDLVPVNALFRHGKALGISAGDGDLHAYLRTLFDSLEPLPRSTAIRLWRGGSNHRLTGGIRYRNGELVAGDVLVSTDITSFTENPYVLRAFVAPRTVIGEDRFVHLFDDTSVVYELVVKGVNSGVPVAPLSFHGVEAEVLYTPGCYFRIESIRQVRGETYHFVKVRLREVEKPEGEPVYDLRTGDPFDREAWAERVNDAAMTERFFPRADDHPDP
ncbi:MAG TPA: DUF6543 domain-containing protein [Pseudomonas sp.]|uniref:dermonecrotic toxin domain-containing protein n=1 Tax=Pseudomonas sp. TaxID=306 RepID=UPI002B490D9E|nr:DUF6543 domain-containing protein [Pseudomonas sp.]HKS14919.1 DUF6543 domain-containing protein [Pseudomonas sp.]